MATIAQCCCLAAANRTTSVGIGGWCCTKDMCISFGWWCLHRRRVVVVRRCFVVFLVLIITSVPLVLLLLVVELLLLLLQSIERTVDGAWISGIPVRIGVSRARARRSGDVIVRFMVALLCIRVSLRRIAMVGGHAATGTRPRTGTGALVKGVVIIGGLGVVVIAAITTVVSCWTVSGVMIVC